MSRFVAIFGTVAAPIYAGFIDETIGWRWIEGIQGLANLPLLAVIAICFRETRGGVTLHKRAKAVREATGDERYRAPMDLEARDIKEVSRFLIKISFSLEKYENSSVFPNKQN